MPQTQKSGQAPVLRDAVYFISTDALSGDIVSQLPFNSLLSRAYALAPQAKLQGLGLAATVLGHGASPKPERGLGLYSASTNFGLGAPSKSKVV